MGRSSLYGFVVAIGLTALSGNAMAFKLGAPEAARGAGDKLVVEVPVELTTGESIVRAAVAPDSVYGTLGIPFPPSMRSAMVVMADKDGRTHLRVHGGTYNGTTLPLLLEIDTNNGRVLRQLSVPLPSKERTPDTSHSDVRPSVVKAAAVPVAAAPAPAPAVQIQSGKLEQLMAMQGRSAQQMDDLNSNLDRIAGVVGELAKQLQNDSVATTAALATIQANTTPKPVVPPDWWAENLPAALAGIVGFCIGGLWFVGSRPKLPAGSKVQLVGAGNEPLEGELVRLGTPSDGKGLPYRIADMLTGAPRCIEVRMAPQITGQVHKDCEPAGHCHDSATFQVDKDYGSVSRRNGSTLVIVER